MRTAEGLADYYTRSLGWEVYLPPPGGLSESRRRPDGRLDAVEAPVLLRAVLRELDRRDDDIQISDADYLILQLLNPQSSRHWMATDVRAWTNEWSGDSWESWTAWCASRQIDPGAPESFGTVLVWAGMAKGEA